MNNTSVLSNTECSGGDEIVDESVQKNSDSMAEVNKLNNLSEEYLMSEIDTQNLNLYPNELDDIEEELLGENDESVPRREVLSVQTNPINESKNEDKPPEKVSASASKQEKVGNNSNSSVNVVISNVELLEKSSHTEIKNSNELNNENLSEVSGIEDGMKTVLKVINSLNECSANGFAKLEQSDIIDNRNSNCEIPLPNNNSLNCENIQNNVHSDNNTEKEEYDNLICFENETDLKISSSATNESKADEILLINFNDETDDNDTAQHRSDTEIREATSNICDSNISVNNKSTLGIDMEMLMNSNNDKIEPLKPTSYKLEKETKILINTACQDQKVMNSHEQQSSWNKLNFLPGDVRDEKLDAERAENIQSFTSNECHSSSFYLEKINGTSIDSKINASVSMEIDENLNIETITNDATKGETKNEIIEKPSIDVEMKLASESNNMHKSELAPNQKDVDGEKATFTSCDEELKDKVSDRNPINNVITIHDLDLTQDGGCKKIEDISIIENIEICESIVNEIVYASIKSTEFLDHHTTLKQNNTFNIVRDILNEVIYSISDNNGSISNVFTIGSKSSDNTQNGILNPKLEPSSYSLYSEESMEFETMECRDISEKTILDQNKDKVESTDSYMENKHQGNVGLLSVENSMVIEEELVSKSLESLGSLVTRESRLIVSLILDDILSRIGESNIEKQSSSSFMEQINHIEDMGYLDLEPKEGGRSIAHSILDDIISDVCQEKECSKSFSDSCLGRPSFENQNTEKLSILDLQSEETVTCLPADINRLIASSILDEVLFSIYNERSEEDNSVVLEKTEEVFEKMDYEESLCCVENIGLTKKEYRLISSSILDEILSAICDQSNDKESTLKESASRNDDVVDEKKEYEESLSCMQPKENSGPIIKEGQIIASSILDDILSGICDQSSDKESTLKESASRNDDVVEEKMEYEESLSCIQQKENSGLIIKEDQIIASSILDDIFSGICDQRTDNKRIVKKSGIYENIEMDDGESFSRVVYNENIELSMKEEGRLIATSLLNEILSRVCVEESKKTVTTKEFLEDVLNDIIKDVVKDDEVEDDFDSNYADNLIDWNSNEYNEDTSSTTLTDITENSNGNLGDIWRSEAKIIDILSNFDDPMRLEKVGFAVDLSDKREDFNVDVVLNHTNFQEEKLISEISSRRICLDILDEIIAHVTYYKIMKRKSEDHSYYQLSKIPRKETETSIVVSCVIEDILSTVFEKNEIVTDILDEIINKAVDSAENKKKRRKYKKRDNIINLPLILDTKSISAETFHNLQGPVRHSTRIRTKVIESFDFSAAVIKDEPEDYIEINVDEEDIKPVLPLPEELQAIAAQQLKKQKKPVVKRNQRKAQSVTRPPKKIVEPVKKPSKTIVPLRKKINRSTTIPKVNPIVNKRSANLPRAAKASANVLLKFDLSKVNWDLPPQVTKVPNQKKSKNEQETITSKVIKSKSDQEIVTNKKVKRDTPMSPVRNYPPAKKVKIVSPKEPVTPIPIPQIITRTKKIAVEIPPPAIEKQKRGSPIKKLVVVTPPSPPKRKAPILRFTPPEIPAPKFHTARKSTSLPPKILKVSPVSTRTLPLILRRSPVTSRLKRLTPSDEVAQDDIVDRPPKRRVIYITPAGIPINVTPAVVPPKRSVAVKSTATRPIHVARKRGKLYVKPKEVLFENFDTYEDLSSNENDYGYKEFNMIQSKTSDKTHCQKFNIFPCMVRLERNSYIDHLLPNKGKSREAICELCEPKRFFVSKDGLVEHLKKEHNDTFSSAPSTSAMPTGNRCSGCDKKYFSQNRLSMHMQNCPALSAMASNLKILSCPSSSSSKPVEEELRHNCEVCGAKFSIWSAFKAHQKTHVQEDHDPLNLDPDDESSSRKFKSVLLRRGPGLVMKFRRERDPELPVPVISQCTICNLAFHYEADLERHRLTHVRIKEERLSPEVEILEEFLVKRPIGVPVEPPLSSPTFIEPIVKAPTARKSTGGPRPAEKLNKVLIVTSNRRKQHLNHLI